MKMIALGVFALVIVLGEWGASASTGPKSTVCEHGSA